MFNLIAFWFKNLSATKKIFTITVLFFLIIIAVLSVRLSYSEYLRLKGIESQFKEAKDKIEAFENRELELIEELKKVSLKASKDNKGINKKLKQDEETINNDTVSNNDLIDFLAKHENKDR
jgi:sensor histidine kinase YesM